MVIQMTNASSEQERRWASEAEFFNNQEYSTDKLDPLVLNRYLKCSRPYLWPEYEFYVLGNLLGKAVLEVGCGDGSRSIMMALRGAHVVALDLSSHAIEAARIRAEKHGLGDRIEFHVTPMELFHTDARFDVITAFALLHHLIPVLDSTLRQLKQYGKPGTRYLFSEPISLSKTLRRLRLMLPISINGTDDERPLERAELDIIRRNFRRADFRYFNAALRVLLRIAKGSLEAAPFWKRQLFYFAGHIDAIVLQKLGCHTLASVTIIEACD
jgi:2-polyprenyl-3-methyl-5-hydroxy-6-metoxy-1,4-benzoquinol methylase